MRSYSVWNDVTDCHDKSCDGAEDAVQFANAYCECFAHVARVLIENVRDSDIVGRLGGDEFGVLLPYTDEPGA